MKKKKILGKRTDGEDRQKFGGKQIKIIIVGKRGKTWKLTTKSWAAPPPPPNTAHASAMGEKELNLKSPLLPMS